MIVPEIVLGLGLVVPPAGERPEIMVYAAASLQDAMEAITPTCEARAGVRLVFNFAASNVLARQILAAHRADIFFSADEAWMDAIAREGLLDEATRRPLLSNRLAVVAREDAGIAVGSAADLASDRIRRISLADPEAVPAGRYARAWLEKAGVWQAARDKVVPALDVRAALAAVESGAVEVGVVYRTDAALSRKVRVLLEVPEDEGPRISYLVAALRGRPRLDAARRVVDCLAGPDAASVFARLGFAVPGPSP